MQPHHPLRAHHFNPSMRTALSLRTTTSMLLAFSFFITPFAPVLAQTAPSDITRQPTTNTQSTDQASPQPSSLDTTTTIEPDTPTAPRHTSRGTDQFSARELAPGLERVSTSPHEGASNNIPDQTSSKDTSKQSKNDKNTTPTPDVSMLTTDTPGTPQFDKTVGRSNLAPQIDRAFGNMTYTHRCASRANRPFPRCRSHLP